MKSMSQPATYVYDYMHAIPANEESIQEKIQERISKRKYSRRASRRNLLIISLVYFSLLAYFIF